MYPNARLVDSGVVKVEDGAGAGGGGGGGGGGVGVVYRPGVQGIKVGYPSCVVQGQSQRLHK